MAEPSKRFKVGARVAWYYLTGQRWIEAKVISQEEYGQPLPGDPAPVLLNGAFGKGWMPEDQVFYLDRDGLPLTPGTHIHLSNGLTAVWVVATKEQVIKSRGAEAWDQPRLWLVRPDDPTEICYQTSSPEESCRVAAAFKPGDQVRWADGPGDLYTVITNEEATAFHGEDYVKAQEGDIWIREEEGPNKGFVFFAAPDSLEKIETGPSPEGPSEEDTNMAEQVKKWNDVKLERTREALIRLPEGMSYKEAAEWCLKMDQADEQPIGINETIDAFPLDAGIALMKALKATYGWTDLRPTPTMFGPKPPQYVSVKINPQGDTVQVPWGRIAIPGVDGHLTTGFAFEEGRLVFQLGGTVKKKDTVKVHAIAALTREILARESIYKGKAIQIEFKEVDPEEGTFNPFNNVPRFIDLSSVREDELIFPKPIRRLLNAGLFMVLEQREKCLDLQLPIKRGILLEGPPGVGKTLTTHVAALKGTSNGWTYVEVDSVEQLADAMRFVRGRYEPAVIVAEDLDRIDPNGDRNDKMNEVLNIIGGNEFKECEIVVVLTTNRVEAIHQTMLRPGRLDMVIPVRPANEEAAAALIRLYSRGQISDEEDLSPATARVVGQNPAVIREVVERAKRFALAEGKLVISVQDVVDAADSMREHMELLVPKKRITSNLADAALTLGKAMTGQLGEEEQVA